MTKRLCFLGYDRHRTRLIEVIKSKGYEVDEVSKPMKSFAPYDVVVSFGYRHIIKQPALDTLRRPAINLHIAYLPYNRGADPNFWSWIEGTPAGVTIHEIDAGIDTGPICFQKQLTFPSENIPLWAAYQLLIMDIEDLFIDNIDSLLGGTHEPAPQVGKGTYHNVSDLPEWMDVEMKICDARERYAKGEN